MSPARRRAATAYLVGKCQISERRACKLVGQHRSTNRYVAVPPEFEQRLVKEMRVLAERHPRYGYRRVHALLVAAGWGVNVKRVERLWRAEGLRVPPRRSRASGLRAQGSGEFSAQKLPSVRPGHVWAYDFAAGRLADGSAYRVLLVIDEYTRFCVGAWVARSIGARDVEGYLEAAFEVHGSPSMIRSDNGREFIAETLAVWLRARGTTPVQVDKGSPQQNPFIERLVGSLRDEVLDREQFHSLLAAGVVISHWREEYNQLRPHRSLGMKTPAAYAAYCAANPPLDGQCP